MTKSTIIKDFANGEVTIDIALKRLLVLLSAFDKPELVSWVKGEMVGYNDTRKLPKYRQFKGYIKGDFFVEGGQFTKYPLPISMNDSDFVDKARTVNICQGTKAILHMISEYNAITTPIPYEVANILIKHTNIIEVSNAYAEITKLELQNILSSIEFIILETLVLLEKEFGNLDSNDIDLSKKDIKEIEQIINKIHLIMNIDNSISIGDNNKISNTEISAKTSKSFPVE